MYICIYTLATARLYSMAMLYSNQHTYITHTHIFTQQTQRYTSSPHLPEHTHIHLEYTSPHHPACSEHVISHSWNARCGARKCGGEDGGWTNEQMWWLVYVIAWYDNDTCMLSSNISICIWKHTPVCNANIDIHTPVTHLPYIQKKTKKHTHKNIHNQTTSHKQACILRMTTPSLHLPCHPPPTDQCTPTYHTTRYPHASWNTRRVQVVHISAYPYTKNNKNHTHAHIHTWRTHCASDAHFPTPGTHTHIHQANDHPYKHYLIPRSQHPAIVNTYNFHAYSILISMYRWH